MTPLDRRKPTTRIEGAGNDRTTIHVRPPRAAGDAAADDRRGAVSLYRKKPVVVQAMCIESSIDNRDPDGSESFLDANGRSIARVSGWMLGAGFKGFKVSGDHPPFGIAIETLEGVMVASPGDWIIRGVQGEFYLCKPDIFEATYDEVSA